MLVDLGLIAVGIFLLAYAGDKLIDFASGIAVQARLTPAVIGLTILAAGTSVPELFVSATAAMKGSPAIAIANVAGSNIANITLVLGIASLVAVVPVQPTLLKLDYQFMAITSFVTVLLCRDLLLDRLEAGFFLFTMIAFISYMVVMSKKALPAGERKEIEASVQEVGGMSKMPLWLLLAGTAVSFVGLGLGSRALVAGAVSIAGKLGVSERIIGLTIVAVGTSLPELVATVAAGLKGEHEMAVANIVGSNIFNLMLILGVSGLITPIPVDPKLVQIDLWVMIAATLLLLPLVVWDRKLTRFDGGILLTFYASYMGFLVYYR